MAETDQMKELLTKAILMRACGHTWKEVAEACGRDESTCCSWPSGHRQLWAELSKKILPALEDAAREAALAALRRQEHLAKTASSQAVRARCNADVLAFGSKTMTQRQEVEHSGKQAIKFVFADEEKAEGD